MLEEHAPGVYGWTDGKVTGHRAFAVVTDGQVVWVDPIAPAPEERRQLAALGPAGAIVLTGPYHDRDAAALARELGVPIYAPQDALAALGIPAAQPLPDVLPGGLEAWPAPGSFPGQTDLYLARDGGSLIVGDSWHNLAFEEKPWLVRLLMRHVFKLRDGLHLTPPARCPDPARLIASYREVLKRPVKRLLVTHGACIADGAGDRMRARLEQGA